MILPTSFSPVEQQLISCAADGIILDLGPNSDEEKLIRAELVVMLCTAAKPEWPVHRKGVRIKGELLQVASIFNQQRLPANYPL